MSKQYLFDKGILQSIDVYIDERFDNLDEFKEQTDGGFYFVERNPSLAYEIYLGQELGIRIPTKILNLIYASQKIIVDIEAKCGVIVEGKRFIKDLKFKRTDFFKRVAEVIEEEEVDFCSGEKRTPSRNIKKICKNLQQRIGSNCVISDTYTFIIADSDYLFTVDPYFRFESAITKITYHKKIKTWAYDFMNLDISGNYQSVAQKLKEIRTGELIPIQGSALELFETGDFTKEEACNPTESESFISQIGPPNPNVQYYYIPSKKLWFGEPIGETGNTLVTSSYATKQFLEEEYADTFAVKEFDFGNDLYFKLFYKKEEDEDLDEDSFATFIDEINLKGITTNVKYQYKEF